MHPLLKHFINAQDETLGWITGPLTFEESQKNSGWTLKISAPELCPKQGQLWDQSRLLKALSTLVLKTSGDRIAFQGNLVCCLSVIMGENSLDTPWINHFCYYFPHDFCPLPTCHCEQCSPIFLMTLCRRWFPVVLWGISAQLLTGQVLLSPACLPLRPLQFFHACP